MLIFKIYCKTSVNLDSVIIDYKEGPRPVAGHTYTGPPGTFCERLLNIFYPLQKANRFRDSIFKGIQYQYVQTKSYNMLRKKVEL